MSGVITETSLHSSIHTQCKTVHFFGRFVQRTEFHHLPKQLNQRKEPQMGLNWCKEDVFWVGHSDSPKPL